MLQFSLVDGLPYDIPIRVNDRRPVFADRTKATTRYLIEDCWGDCFLLLLNQQVDTLFFMVGGSFMG
jgi:hypothetical protein